MIPAEWKDDRQKLGTALYEDIISVLTKDTDPRVRHEALITAGQMQLTDAGSDLAASFIALLIDRYHQDQDGRVRSEIVKTFRLIRTDSPEIRGVLRDALVDPQESVRFEAQAAIRPQATPYLKLTFSEAREVIVAALKSADAGVRLGAVQALNNFGKAARDYIPTLQSLTTRDPDPRVRESAALAIEAIRRDRI